MPLRPGLQPRRLIATITQHIGHMRSHATPRLWLRQARRWSSPILTLTITPTPSQILPLTLTLCLYPAGAKLFYLSGMRNGKYMKREVLNLARFISVTKFRPLSWRGAHPYLVADRFEVRYICLCSDPTFDR